MRLFIGIPVPQETAIALAQLADRLPSSARRTRPENMHVTLSFLGEAKEEKLPIIVDELTKLDHEAFEILLVRLATFPGVFHAEVQLTPSLSRLQAHVVERMQRCGFPPEERGYHPHITLARSRDRFRGANRIPFEPMRFTAQAVVLYRSNPGSSGSSYEHLYEVPLLNESEM